MGRLLPGSQLCYGRPMPQYYGKSCPVEYSQTGCDEEFKVFMRKISGRSQIAISLTLLLALGSLADAQRSPSSSADLLLMNAHVITMDRTQPTAEAIAIRGDRIVWVGTN